MHYALFSFAEVLFESNNGRSPYMAMETLVLLIVKLRVQERKYSLHLFLLIEAIRSNIDDDIIGIFVEYQLHDTL